ncbi:MAG: Fic family protein [Proteobacteria bacterium]|nr:Fic family protein [Pseudomonadota bacterium]
MKDRKSIAEDPKLITDLKFLKEKERQNNFAQISWAMEEVYKWINNKEASFKPSVLFHLNRLALDSIHLGAGSYRNTEIKIKGSRHNPIHASKIPDEVEQMMEYLSDNWERETPIHLAAYAMWRVNWIHPFFDGNGRTARIFSYMVLCAKTEFVPVNGNAIPEQILANKQPYYKALEDADTHYKKGKIDVSKIEHLLTNYLSEQLLGVHQQATGKTGAEDQSNPNEPQSRIKRESRFSKWYDKIEKRPVLISIIVAIGLFILGYFLI